jgi:metal-dependent amidase/aminoacylase/carboxypeptidase family protein
MDPTAVNPGLPRSTAIAIEAFGHGPMLTIHGHRGHGAMPHQCIDPVVVCASIIKALQTTRHGPG